MKSNLCNYRITVQYESKSYTKPYKSLDPSPADFPHTPQWHFLLQSTAFQIYYYNNLTLTKILNCVTEDKNFIIICNIKLYNCMSSPIPL